MIARFERKRLERGHPDGRGDRDVLVVELVVDDRVRETFQFSANWDPHGFRLVEASPGVYYVEYLLGERGTGCTPKFRLP